VLARLATDREAAGIVRATAVALLAGSPGHPAALSAVRFACRDPDPLLRMAATRALPALGPSDAVPVAAPLLRDPVRAVRIDAAARLVGAPTSLLTPEQRADLDAALGELRAAEALNADQPESHVNLANVERALGNLPAAEALCREALRVDDSFVGAYVDLADLLREQKRDGEGEQLLRAALERFPDEPALHHALGLLLVRTGRHAEAESQEAIAARAGTEPRAELMYALLLQRRGDGERALEILQASARAHPGDLDVVGALLSMLTERGDDAASLQWAEHLLRLRPDDVQLALEVRRLRESAGR